MVCGIRRVFIKWREEGINQYYLHLRFSSHLSTASIGAVDRTTTTSRKCLVWIGEQYHGFMTQKHPSDQFQSQVPRRQNPPHLPAYDYVEEGIYQKLSHALGLLCCMRDVEGGWEGRAKNRQNMLWSLGRNMFDVHILLSWVVCLVLQLTLLCPEPLRDTCGTGRGYRPTGYSWYWPSFRTC